MGKSGPVDKSFDISKQLVWEAYRRVKANKGAAGVDGVTMEMFETDLRNNLYKIWNRMSSGTYFPPAVKAVEIPKPHGDGTRILGVPTVADRIAQTVVALQLEPRTESIFHPDSYGYRPGRSAHDALARCRTRCWKKDWVLDLDIRKFFDSLDHGLVVKAVKVNTDRKWVLLYVKRWLTAPLQLPDGTLVERDRGTPQGSAVSPVLANVVLHYAFDMFLAREFPTVEFERYADDAVVHCVTERQARQVRAALAERLEGLGLQLHPDKTRIVYCKDNNRRGAYEHTSFTFLGYTFQPRAAVDKGGTLFVSFQPAVSKDALKKMHAQVRRWRLHRRTRYDLDELAEAINPIVAGWINYYGRFYRSKMYPLLQRINTYLMRWAGKKYKRLRGYRCFTQWWFGLVDREPELFTHWRWVRTFAGLR
ncbi:group II intron reverse transcriptase/maturase [Haloechinothrix halophila]|uniref:group II intron reverse transcriptase/maturase n=1 Tax=Haloechinothrix halophila TaxID=1069073 RepID=UPI0003F7F524|nr:group II intron reverse transcriptase/maturase [Haloechinothrix halophila]